MSLEPTISVIVPHYRDLQRLDACLSALGRQTHPSEAFEVIVADNDSPEGEAAVAKVIDGRARLVIAHERGAGSARNAGVAVARGRLLAFTDSDCLPDADWLSQGVLALEHFDFVGGRVTVLVDDLQRVTPAEAFERVFAFNNADYVKRKGFTVTANLFCARSLFERVGGFRVGVPEDLDWCHRAAAAGFRIGYADQAIVGHPARRTWQELKTKWRRLNTEAFTLAKTRPGGRWLWLVRSCLLPVSAIAHSPKVFASSQLATLEQRLQALGMLYRLRLWRCVDSLRRLARPDAV
jgi:GT2 family glycosyltransferase